MKSYYQFQISNIKLSINRLMIVLHKFKNIFFRYGRIDG